ncbi:MAG: N-acetylmuramoyl-L-alanine amidase [Actinomycetia bacterium]|nr:N-acetylmuramoyl-L-alanine amidase [Actinomycetes bacterium]
MRGRVRSGVTAACLLLAVAGCGQAHPKPRPTPPAAAQRAPVLRGFVIVVDPGHGRDPRTGRYTGATGVNGVAEDANVLDIAVRLAHLLRADGATVVVTRGTYDPGPPPIRGLMARVRTAARVHANLFISIHQNDDPRGRPSTHGAATYYFTPASRALALDVQRALVAGTGLQDDGIHRRAFFVLLPWSRPSVLVEGGYLSNPQEARRISTARFHQEEAAALARGIVAYARSRPLRP